ncbi:MAG TPA: NADH-quinone oxidoreductase subunit N [Candidatus Acidoferrales bacterium]|nr:NADH-quinone oxidoreductase subunit N [Candidatus Acidoferrales bacterium]
MSSADFVALLPLIVLGAASVAAMLAIAARRSHSLTAGVSLAGLAVAFWSLWPAVGVVPRQVTPLLVIDRFAIFYMGLIVAATAAVVLMAYGYFERQHVVREEFYVLLLVAALGCAVLVAANHFVSFFLGLEILSVTLYALSAYLPDREVALEAGLKYLVLAAGSAAFLLFGMALVYAQTGTMEFPALARALALGGAGHLWVLAGVAFMITGFGFKLAVVPFHLWTPDVYQGAPAPVTAFIASVSKGAMFAILLRFFYQSGSRDLHSAGLVFTIIAVCSMLAGNLLALLQDNVKRILAYSSIAHLGYLLVAFEAGGPVGAAAGTFYLTAYMVTTLGAFGVVTMLSSSERDAEEIADYRGLFWRRPALAAVFTAMLFSLAGIPLTAGFLGKFYTIAAGASQSLWLLIFVLVVSSAIGLYYYLRIVVALFATEPVPAAAQKPYPALGFAGGATLVALALILIWLGVYPHPILDAIQSAMASLL